MDILNKRAISLALTMTIMVGLMIAMAQSAAAAGADNLNGPATDIASFPFTDSTATGTMTTEIGEFGTCGNFYASSDVHSVWYKYTPTATGWLAVDTLTSNYDTVLEVYSGSAASPTFGALTSVSCNDDGGGFIQSYLNVPVTAGTTYYIVARDSGIGSGGNLTVNASFSTLQQIYVKSSGGNDSNPGTAALPVKTIQQGINLASNGAIINIMTGGTYAENVSIYRSLTLSATAPVTTTSFLLTQGAVLSTATTSNISAPLVNVNQVGGTGARISDALFLVSAGGAVNVGAGTYTETLTITKSVTMQGPTNVSANISPGSGVAVAISAGAVTFNNFTIQNATTAISITGGSGHSFFHNNLTATPVGISNTTGVSVTAANNWWGNATGPFNATSNPTGTGGQVSDNIGFSPWCNVAAPTCIQATKLIFTASPVDTTAGATLTPTIKAVNNSNIVDPNFTGAVVVTIGTNPGGGTLTGTTVVTAVSGIITYTNLSIDKAGVGYTLVGNYSGLTAATSNPFTITAAAANYLTFTVSPGNTQSQATLSPAPVVEARDQFGNLAKSFSGNMAITYTGGTAGAAMGGTLVVAANNGVVTYTNLSINFVGANYQLVASSAGLTNGTSSAFNIIADRLIFSTSPNNALAGAATLSATIAARDNFGYTDTTYTGSIGLAIGTNPGAGTLSGFSSAPAVSGVITYTGMFINKVGVGYTLSATASNLITGTSSAFNITPAPASQLIFASSPLSNVAGSPTITAVVQAQDAFGNLASAFGGTVTATITSGSGTPGAVLGGSTAVVAVGGVITYTGLSINLTGLYQLDAGSPGLITGTSSIFAIDVVTPTLVVVTTSPTNTVVAALLNGPVVEVQDNFGNRAYGFNGVISVTIRPGTGTPGATLGGTTSITASSGAATFTDLALDKAGTAYQLIAQSGALATDITGAFDIGKGTQNIAFGILASKVYTNPPFLVTATVNSPLVISYTTATPSVCTNTGNLITIVGVGNCTVVANQPGNADWNPALPVSRTFSVSQAFQTISFTLSSSMVYTNTPFLITATASSGLLVGLTAGPGNVCTINGSLVTLVNVGMCTVVASQSGNANYASAPNVSQSFTITQASQIINFGPLANIPFTNTAVLVTATVNSGLPISYTASGACSNSGGTNALTLINIGVCTVTATQPGTINFAVAPPNAQAFTVSKGNDVITFPNILTVTFGTPPFPVTGTSASGLQVFYSPLTPGVCTISGNIVTLVSLGTCTVGAFTFGNSIWNAAPITLLTFNVALGTQTIDFPSIADRTVLSPTSFTISATASSGLAVTFSFTPTSICQGISSGPTTALVLLSGALGTCTVTADQLGNTNFAPAPQVTRPFSITKVPQTITFAPLPNRTTADPPFTVSASASSSLAVTFIASGSCTVVGNLVTLKGPGTCTITAQQAGNATYAAAPDVSQSFNISTFNRVFLPLVTRDYGPPDLVVTAFTVTPANPVAGQPATVTVVVKNQGNSQTGSFWVDFYINPARPPVGPNDPWNATGNCTLKPCYGIVWFVAGGLAPGQSVTLVSVPSSYDAQRTVWPGAFASGSSDLYVFVDSWNPTVATGAVTEFDETNNRAEIHNLGVLGPNPASALRVPLPEQLPARPALSEK